MTGLAVTKATSWAQASSTDSLTRVRSNWDSARSSSRAAASRRSTPSADSVSRAVSRRTSSSQDGGARKTSRAPGIAARIWPAPTTSTSISTGTPAAGGHLLELGLADEVVLAAMLLPRPGGPGRDRHGHPHLRAGAPDRLHDRALADAGRAGEDDRARGDGDSAGRR